MGNAFRFRQRKIANVNARNYRLYSGKERQLRQNGGAVNQAARAEEETDRRQKCIPVTCANKETKMEHHHVMMMMMIGQWSERFEVAVAFG